MRLHRFLFIPLLAGLPPAQAVELPGQQALDGRKLEEPARILKQQDGIYPEHLVDNGIYVAGIVQTTIEIDATGRVTAAKVNFASHPAFVPAALTAIFASKYSPGKIGGQPVASLFSYNIGFNVVGRLGGMVGTDVSRLGGKIPGLPADYDYDIPPVLSAFCEPVYPRELLDREVKGEAAVRVVLDPRGMVATGEVLSATQPEFGLALLAAVETWRFLPAKRNGVPTQTVIDINRKFLPFGFRRPVAETQVQKELRRGGKAIVGPAALDRPLRPLYQVEPQYPRALDKKKESGEAVVEILVHENGQVVLPVVVSATRPEFGWAATTAVQQWVFEKPQVGKKGVAVRHRLTFSFSP